MKTKNNDPIAYAIRKVIQEKGLLIKWVAKQAGYTSQQFSDMLNNRKIIRADDLLKISLVLEVPVDELFAIGKNINCNK